MTLSIIKLKAVITLPMTLCMLTKHLEFTREHSKVSFTSAAAAGEVAKKYNYEYRRKLKGAVSEKKPSRKVATPRELVR